MVRRYYVSYHEEDEQLRTLMILLLVFLGIWWGILHFLDWITLDFIPWWLEILLFFPFLFLSGVVIQHGRNPLHWWPICWGTRVKIPDDLLFHINYDEDRFIRKHGGPLNVWIGDEHIKFRRRRDAVTFCLLNY